MKHYTVYYLFQTLSKSLELKETPSFPIMELRDVTPDWVDTVSMFSVKLSFKAESDDEALRMAVINTDQSLLVFKNDSEIMDYHVKVQEGKWLGKMRTIENQFYSFSSLSA